MGPGRWRMEIALLGFSLLALSNMSGYSTGNERAVRATYVYHWPLPMMQMEPAAKSDPQLVEASILKHRNV